MSGWWERHREKRRDRGGRRTHQQGCEYWSKSVTDQWSGVRFQAPWLDSPQNYSSGKSDAPCQANSLPGPNLPSNLNTSLQPLPSRQSFLPHWWSSASWNPPHDAEVALASTIPSQREPHFGEEEEIALPFEQCEEVLLGRAPWRPCTRTCDGTSKQLFDISTGTISDFQHRVNKKNLSNRMTFHLVQSRWNDIQVIWGLHSRL